MAKVSIDLSGTKRYYHDNGQLSRLDGPAVITKLGNKYWYEGNYLYAIHSVDGKYDCYKKPRRIDNPNGFKMNFDNLGFNRWPEL